MIKRILLFLIFGFIIMGIIFWLVNGGPSKVIAGARSQPNFIASFLTGTKVPDIFSIKLPWSNLAPNIKGADISGYINTDADTTSQGGSAGYSQQQLDQVKTFGTPSPHRSRVTLRAPSATEKDPAKEYLTMSTASNNTDSININGWSLQSVVSGVRVYLPTAAQVFISGNINNTTGVTLAPGASVILTSGTSPVGVSFRQNICSGYLGDLQTFTPYISTASCPSPSDALPETPDNLRTYGSNCLDYVRNLSSCRFPQDIPSTLSGACKALVANTFSYNGCVRLYGDTPSFTLNSWRLFLNSPIELWDNAHDIIRLLDEQGRTVDAVTY